MVIFHRYVVVDQRLLNVLTSYVTTDSLHSRLRTRFQAQVGTDVSVRGEELTFRRQKIQPMTVSMRQTLLQIKAQFHLQT